MKRVGKNAKVIKADVRKLDTWWDGEKFDSILLDVPCSSSGVLKRNPDIRFSRKKKELLDLLNLQNDILIVLENTERKWHIDLFNLFSFLL